MIPTHPEAATLLDETDVLRRVLQHTTILVAILLLASAAGVADSTLDSALALIAAGFALFAIGALIDQRWDVTYKGHRIRVVNNPFRGEKLFIDDVPVAKGQLGLRSEMRAPIAAGSGAGDVIAATCEAGLLRYRCRIVAHHAAAVAATSAALSDEQLVAELRRRGLSV
jgi:hypothetical protein